MKELNDIIRAYDRAVDANKRVALATVVKVVGSSYRRPGARMLVTEDGLITGAISGGCLEGDALRKAQFAMHQQKNKLEIYDTRDEADVSFGVQLGCNGIVTILFEPIIQDSPENPINLLKKVALRRKEAVLVTAFNEDKQAHQTGTCCLFSEKENSIFPAVTDTIRDTAVTALANKTTYIGTAEKSQVLYQYVPPSIQLVIVGAGNDTQPLAEMSAIQGWTTIVIDGRPGHGTKERFPHADIILILKAEKVVAAIQADEQTAVVLMTHNYNYDIAILEQCLQSNIQYIGTLGPRKKLDRMLDELRDNGTVIGQQDLDRLYGPVGLDIGAETAEEIALSVMAEIKAVFSGRKGSPLKERLADIHTRQ